MPRAAWPWRRRLTGPALRGTICATVSTILRLAKLLFTFRGRLPRGTYWLVTTTTLLVFLVAQVFLESTLGRGSTLALYPPLYWALLALSARRLHDCARGAGWLLIACVPVLGALWLFLELGLRKGTPGDNQYGRDPLERGRDYMTVA